MTRKYELTNETTVIGDVILHRIRALIDIPKHGVNAGDLGGFIEKEYNLSHDGDCWVDNDACVFDDARVFDDAYVYEYARVYGNAYVFRNAYVFGDACISGYARISQGKYHFSMMHIIMPLCNITANYPNHVQIGCKLFEICDKETAIKTMRKFDVPQNYHEQIWLAVQLCKQWLKDNPEKRR